MSDLRNYVRELKERARALENPYFVALANGEMSREDFVETQIQFLFAVVFFSRPMAVLASRIPRPEQRFSVLHNVLEEHGDCTMSLSHERTFLELLERLGVARSEIDARSLWPEVRAFNTVLTGVCTHDDVPTGVAVMGIIEDLFSGISASIGDSIIARGWLASDEIVHYATHEELDVEHADEFYRIIDGYWESNERGRYQIQQGLELGAYVFMRMYRDLFEARARRARRPIGGPHSLAEGWYVDEHF